MASSYKDSSPNSGAKSKGGMKNKDGRMGPHYGPKSAAFNDKNVGTMPNEGAPKLTGKGVIAQER